MHPARVVTHSWSQLRPVLVVLVIALGITLLVVMSHLMTAGVAQAACNSSPTPNRPCAMTPTPMPPCTPSKTIRCPPPQS